MLSHDNVSVPSPLLPHLSPVSLLPYTFLLPPLEEECPLFPTLHLSPITPSSPPPCKLSSSPHTSFPHFSFTPHPPLTPLSLAIMNLSPSLLPHLLPFFPPSLRPRLCHPPPSSQLTFCIMQECTFRTGAEHTTSPSAT